MTNTNSPTEQAEGVKPGDRVAVWFYVADINEHDVFLTNDPTKRGHMSSLVDAPVSNIADRRTPAPLSGEHALPPSGSLQKVQTTPPPSGEGEWVLVPRKVTSEMMSALGGGTDPDLLPMFQADWNDLLAVAPPRQAQPSHDVERETVAPVSVGKCKTPGVYYQTSLASPTTLQVRLRFPFAIEDWALGNSAVTEGPKLQRYNQQAAERKRVDDLIHDQMEVVGADCFRIMDEIHRAFTPGYTLAASEWSEEVGGRPFTVGDWSELTFGEQRTYAERSAALSVSSSRGK